MATAPTLAPGIYAARVVQWAWDTTKGGDVVLGIELEIARGSFEGHRELAKLYWSEKALPHSLAALRRIGWLGTDVALLEDATPPAGEIAIRVEHETYQDKLQLRIRFDAEWRPFKPPRAEALAKLTRSCERPLRALDDKLRRLGHPTAEPDSGTGGAAPPSTTAAGEPDPFDGGPGDDDSPFD